MAPFLPVSKSVFLKVRGRTVRTLVSAYLREESIRIYWGKMANINRQRKIVQERKIRFQASSLF
jgi:hypothetical protein